MVYRLITQEWILYPVIFFLAFFIVYLWNERILRFLYDKSLGQREEIIRLLDRMFVEVNRKQITITLLLLSFGMGLLFFVLLWPNLIPGLLVGSFFVLIGWILPARLIVHLYEKRCDRFVDQMVDGLTIMANGVKSGLSITQSMERVVENMSNPISQEFSLVLSQIRIGQTVEEALLELGERIPRPDVQMFVTSINILKETGGNMAETFATIVVTIRERQKLEKKIQALTAQGIMQGVIITLVPLILLVVFLILDPAFVMPLFTTTLGVVLLLTMVGLQIIGGLMIRKIVKINV